MSSRVLALDRLGLARETVVAFEVEDKHTVWLDIDLPEMEGPPEQGSQVAARGYRLLINERGKARRRREYMINVHAIAFRLVGEVFHRLPSVHRVAVSGFSQRPDPGTGQERDDYLFRALVTREAWSEIDFATLAAIDPPECFARFGRRRKMSKTGIFKPIEPLWKARE